MADENHARIGELLTELVARKGWGIHIHRDKASEGGKIGVEFGFLCDSGADYRDGFATVTEALEYAKKSADEYDERMHS